MAINYASKYSSVVDDRFKLGSVTGNLGNPNYDWLGVEAIKVFSTGTSPLNDYVVSGTNRFGTPSELQNEVQTMVLTQDKGFTFTIDKKSEQDTVGTMEIGARLRDEVDLEVIPYIDEYRLNVAVANAGKFISGAVDKTNAMEAFLAAQAYLTNKKVPRQARICYAKPEFINLLKLDPAFTKSCDMAQAALINGDQAGVVDRVPIIEIPADYLPTNTNFIILLPYAVITPTKLIEYRILEEVQGISGAVAEGRVRFDAFVLKNKKDAIVVHIAKTLSSIAVTTAPTKTVYTSGQAFAPAGMVITATYSDSTTAAATGYTFAPATITASGNVTITYKENGVTKTATQAVTVS